jgi:hypothetical protein
MYPSCRRLSTATNVNGYRSHGWLLAAFERTILTGETRPVFRVVLQ